MEHRLVFAFVLSAILLLVIISIGETANTAFAQVLTTIPVGNTPSDITVNDFTNRIYVSNGGSNSVTVIDGATNTVIGSPIPVGNAPGGIAVNPITNKVYVKNFNSGTISVISGSSNTVIKTIGGLNVGSGRVAVDSFSNRVYVIDTFVLRVINGVTDSIIASIPIATNGVGIDVNPITKRAYIGNAGIHNKVTVINTLTNTVVTSITGITQAHFVSVNSNTNRVYAGAASIGQVVVINGATNSIITSINVGIQPRQMAVDELRDRVYVTNGGSNSVTVIDGATNTVIGSPISVGNIPTGMGVNSVTNTAYVANSGSNSVTVIDGSAIGGPPTPTGDLEIISVEPVQVVFDSDALIEGKDTVISVLVKNTFDEDLKVFLKVTATGISDMIEELDMPRNCEKRFFFPSPINNGRCDDTEFHLGSAIVPNAGTFDVSAEIDFPGQIPETNEENNFKDASLPVKKTSLNVPYVQIEKCFTPPFFGDCYGTLRFPNYDFTRRLGNDVTLEMFPVSPPGFEGNHAGSMEGSRISSESIIPVGKGWQKDLNKVYSIAKMFDKNLDRAIGIVPREYFEYHGEGSSLGVTPCNIEDGKISECGPRVLAEEGTITTIQHELAHSYDIDHRFGTPEGYSINSQREIPFEFQVTPVGQPEITISTQNLLCTADNPFGENCFGGIPPRKWLDATTYNTLLDDLSKPKNDPEALIVTGLITKDNEVFLDPWFELPQGTLSDQTPGNYSINILDNSGTSIEEIPFSPMFGGITSNGFIITDVGSFAFTIPYPMETAMIEIHRDEQVLIEVNPQSKTLRDAINGIPDNGYAKNPEERRNALLNKVAALEKMLESDNKKGALKKLNSDIKDKIQKWIVDYTSVNPLELSKEKIIQLIESVDSRIRSSL